MPNAVPVTEEGWAYERAEEAALALEALLSAHGIMIAPRSPLETSIFKVMTLVDRKKGSGLMSADEDVRGTYRAVVGVHELARLILEVKDHSDFATLLPHLRLLNDGVALQNIPAPGGDQATNKLFELFAATLALQIGEDVELDDPFSSTGANPDVLVTLGGRRWGIACKVLHSLHPEGFLTHLAKGLDQIDASPAETGVVLFNMKNVLPHDDFWPLVGGPTGSPGLPGAWNDPDVPFQMLLRSVQQLGADLLHYLPAGYVDTIFPGRWSVAGFLLWAHPVSGARIQGRPTPTSLRLMNFQAAGAVSDKDRAALEALHWAAFPDSPSRGPRPAV